MTILNFLWGFSTGGIGKCFLTYNRLGEVDSHLRVVSICVVTKGHDWDLRPLIDQNIEIINIASNFDFSWMKRVKEVIDGEGIDCFFCHGHNGPVMLSLFSKRYKLDLPFICTCHGFNPKPSLLSRFYFTLAARVLKSNRVKKIICVEKFTPAVLGKRGIPLSKIVTVYNGIDPFVKTIPVDLSSYCDTNAPIVLTASRLTRIKGIDFLLTALKKTKDEGILFHYFCIGDGEEEQSLKSLSSSLGLSGCVSFMGYQNNIADWLATCDVFALPSLEEFHSLGLLEAMRAKKAIIATDVGGNPESVRNEQDAILVPSKDPEALFLALKRLLVSPELRDSLGSSAYQRFQSMFTINAMMSNLAHEIIDTII